MVLAVLVSGMLALTIHPLLGVALFVAIGVWITGRSSPVRRYLRYKRGEAGERLVSQALETLSDDYYIVHDAQTLGGNIDHAILGPNGIFVLETKHHAGVVWCQGDRWWQSRLANSPGLEIRSPSLQVKRIAALTRDRVKMFEPTILKDYPKVAWVHGIVVFSNPNLTLELHSPTVPVVRLQDLSRAILDARSPATLPPPATLAAGPSAGEAAAG
jgi:hypothetical protein